MAATPKGHSMPNRPKEYPNPLSNFAEKNSNKYYKVFNYKIRNFRSVVNVFFIITFKIGFQNYVIKTEIEVTVLKYRHIKISLHVDLLTNITPLKSCLVATNENHLGRRIPDWRFCLGMHSHKYRQ